MICSKKFIQPAKATVFYWNFDYNGERLEDLQNHLPEKRK